MAKLNIYIFKPSDVNIETDEDEIPCQLKEELYEEDVEKERSIKFLDEWLDDNGLNEYKSIFEGKTFEEVLGFNNEYCESKGLSESATKNILKSVSTLNKTDKVLSYSNLLLDNESTMDNAANLLLSLIPSSEHIFLDILGERYFSVVYRAVRKIISFKRLHYHRMCTLFKLECVCHKATYSQGFSKETKQAFTELRSRLLKRLDD